jgi:YbbR domain-containing protein
MERMSLLKGSKFFARMSEDWPAKVLSVALALVLFVFHRMSLLEERFLSVPLQVETNKSLTPASSYPRMIRVTLRGDANTIYPILEEDVEAYMDLTKYTEKGIYRAAIQIRKKGTALAAEPLEIGVDPLELSLELDRRLSKNVHLMANFQGSPEPGYELASYTLDPSQVVVDGPTNILENISELSTDFIDLSGRSVDFSATVRILNRDPLLVIRGSGTAEFRGLIRERIATEDFRNLPVQINNMDDNFSGVLSAASGSVRLRGGQRSLRELPAGDIVMAVDCSTLDDAGDYILPVIVAIPPMFVLVRQDPENVTVRVSRKVDEDENP